MPLSPPRKGASNVSPAFMSLTSSGSSILSSDSSLTFLLYLLLFYRHSNKMISLIASAIDLLAILIKSIFKRKKHKNKQNAQLSMETEGNTIKKLSSEPEPARSEVALGEESRHRHKRKRRKSITETVTRTVTYESSGSPESSQSPGAH